MNTLISIPRCGALAAAALLSCIGVSSVQAASVYDYDVVSFGSFSSANTEVNGTLAVGGDANVSSFGVGTSLNAGYEGPSLVVRGDLTYNNGTVFHGDVVAGGSISGSGLTVNNGTKTANGTGPIDFAAELVRMKGVSALISGLEANGTVSNGGGLTLTGTDAALNVFTIDASDLLVGSGLAVFIPDGSVAIINVTGASFNAAYTGGFTLNGQTISNSSADLASSLLFNFGEAQDISISGSWAGNILAPDASVDVKNGGFFGSLIAGDVTSSSEFYQGRFSGYGDLVPPPAVPEPATWAMMIVGFGLIGGVMRRRTRQPRFA